MTTPDKDPILGLKAAALAANAGPAKNVDAFMAFAKLASPSTILALIEVCEAAAEVIKEAATNTATGEAIILCPAEDVIRLRTALEGVKG